LSPLYSPRSPSLLLSSSSSSSSSVMVSVSTIPLSQIQPGQEEGGERCNTTSSSVHTMNDEEQQQHPSPSSFTFSPPSLVILLLLAFLTALSLIMLTPSSIHSSNCPSLTLPAPATSPQLSHHAPIPTSKFTSINGSSSSSSPSPAPSPLIGAPSFQSFLTTWSPICVGKRNRVLNRYSDGVIVKADEYRSWSIHQRTYHTNIEPCNGG